MNLIYNSAHYSVLEFRAESGLEALRYGAFEILDKPSRREIFLAGPLAETFRQHVQALSAQRPTEEEIDEFLGSYTPLMAQPVILQ
jgi:hypothetical protein